ncbi:Ferredoxin, 2Fe-2S [Methylophaga thiooxydans]|uniref:Ferredoxin, 2Fe-2S n=2 Tax=Methylophaga thiooxydans TaxID=392484 RepID=A0A0A0BK48_9GAMM|nr:Ferredoxin, 2Fe-2S [Methylophaga thiooxydans]
MRDYAKQRVKELKLKKVRVNNAGCLNRCKLGPMLVIYPEGIWYRYENKEDIDEIIESHLIQGEIVERLQK